MTTKHKTPQRQHHDPAVPAGIPSEPGTYYGELSPDKVWFWDGTGLPGDAWIPNPTPQPAPPIMAGVPSWPPPQITPQVTSSQLAYDWIELYLTPVTGP